MKKTIVLAAVVTLLFSCGKSAPTPDPTPAAPEKIPIKLSFSPTTKVTDLAYESGDVVGLYVVNDGSTLNPSGNHADNLAFSFDGSTWKSAAELYWKDQNTGASFYSYYPRVNTVSDISAIPFSVNFDQSTLQAYQASELLWGSRSNVAPTSEVVDITSTHRMSKLLIYVVPGNGYSEESFGEEKVEIVLNSLKASASLNLQTGEVTASGNPADIRPYMDNDHYTALVPPQSLSDQTLISLKVGDYSFSHKETITLKSNTQHKVTLTVNKVSEGINIGIGSWETDNTDYGGTVN